MNISVVIPVYNVGELLRNSVESILAQRDDNCELIIVDDGSTDNSGAICDEYSSLSGVRVIHKENGGLSSARNAGIDIAKGDYLLFLDSDDYFRPGSIGLLNSLIHITGRFDFIQFRYDEVSDYSDKAGVKYPEELFELRDRRQMFEQKFALGGIGASACTKLINREVFNTLRFKEGIIHEDEQFTIHLINRSSRALYMSNPLYMYVQRPGSIITSKFSRKRLDIIPVLEEQIAILQSCGYTDLADRVRNNLFTMMCVMYAEARRCDMHECVNEIQAEVEAVLPGINIKDGTFGLIAKGLKMRLPMLPLYYIYKRICNGKA